jgi:hypothetical protein
MIFFSFLFDTVGNKTLDEFFKRSALDFFRSSRKTAVRLEILFPRIGDGKSINVLERHRIKSRLRNRTRRFGVIVDERLDRLIFHSTLAK